VELNFGKFWKCGFYDWRLVQINPQGQMKPLDQVLQETQHEKLFGNRDTGDEDQFGTQLAQGRFVVHAKGLKDESFHEI
jgi:starch synthase